MSTPEMHATTPDAARAGETASVPQTGETAEPRIEEPEPTTTAAYVEGAANTSEIGAKEEPVTSEPSVEPTKPEQPSTTTSAEPVPKLNPSATEFISRSSSTGPGEGKPNALAGSRHAGRGARRGARQSGAGAGHRPTSQQEQGGGNPVVLAPVEGVDVAGMTGFRGKVVREARPPRGYVPPAPERKARLTAEELEEKMARMRLVNERTQAEQEARNADAQAYESQVSIERERAAAERERRRAEAEAKSQRTLAVQQSIDQQREQYRLRKLKLLEAQGGAMGGEQEESYGPREPRSEREGYGGYGYGGGRMSGRGGYGGEHGEQYAGSGRGDHRGRGRGGNRGRPAGGVTPRPVSAAKAPVATVPDTKDAGAFPALKTDVGKDVAAKEPDASET